MIQFCCQLFRSIDRDKISHPKLIHNSIVLFHFFPVMCVVLANVLAWQNWNQNTSISELFMLFLVTEIFYNVTIVDKPERN